MPLQEKLLNKYNQKRRLGWHRNIYLFLKKLGRLKVGGYQANIGRAREALIIIKGSLLMGYKWDKPKTFISRKETANELLLRNRPSFKTIDPMRN